MKILSLFVVIFILSGCSTLDVLKSEPTASGYASVEMDSKTARVLEIKERRPISPKNEYFYPHYPKKIFLKPGSFLFHLQCSSDSFKSHIEITHHFVPVSRYIVLNIPDAKSYILKCNDGGIDHEDQYLLEEI